MIHTLGTKVNQIIARHGPIPVIERAGDMRWFKVKQALRRADSRGYWEVTSKSALYAPKSGGPSLRFNFLR